VAHRILQKSLISAAWAASAACPSEVPTYTIVLVIDLCPSACLIKARLTFPATRWEASECFKTCGCPFSLGSPAASATAWNTRKNCVRSSLPPFCDVKRKSEPSVGRAFSQARSAASSSNVFQDRRFQPPTHPWVGACFDGSSREPASNQQTADLCRIWWHSLQSVIRFVSASSPSALRLLM
jgi:hypothetical protein